MIVYNYTILVKPNLNSFKDLLFSAGQINDISKNQKENCSDHQNLVSFWHKLWKKIWNNNPTENKKQNQQRESVLQISFYIHFSFLLVLYKNYALL